MSIPPDIHLGECTLSRLSFESSMLSPGQDIVFCFDENQYSLGRELCHKEKYHMNLLRDVYDDKGTGIGFEIRKIMVKSNRYPSAIELQQAIDLLSIQIVHEL